MAWTGLDSIIAAKAAKKIQRALFNKTVVTGATSAAGRWHECLSGGGTGGPMTLTGTAGAGVICNGSTNGRIPLGADVAPSLRNLFKLRVNTGGATLGPAEIILTDIIHVYPSCVLTGAPTALSNHPTWTATGDTRMTDAVGVEASLIVTTATTAGNAEVLPTYLDHGGASQAAARSLRAPATATPIGALYGDTGTAVTVGGPTMALAAGDLGVQRISSYTIPTGGTSGVGAFVLHRPIETIPLPATNTPGMLEWLIGSRIYDDACLGLLIQVGGAATTGQVISGTIEAVYE